jgi:hypothetical protein
MTPESFRNGNVMATSKSSLSKNQEFYASVYQAARELGASPVAAQLAASQASHESNKNGRYGGSGLARNHNNFFGIKAGKSWNGKVANLPTWEEVNGKRVNTPANFRSYPSVKDGIKDYLAVVGRNWPEALTAPTLDAAIAALGAGTLGGYASDSKYANQIAKTAFRNERAVQVAEARVPNPNAHNPVPTSTPLAPVDDLTGFAGTPTPSPRPDPVASRMAQQYSQYQPGTMPSMPSAPGGLFDYSRAAADMTGEFPSYEAEKNLSRSLAGITPNVTSAQGGLLSPAGLAGQYGQYQPASGNAWNDQPTVNERMASPRTPTMEQQRIADAVRQSVAPQVASAPGGLFQSTGAFNNVNQTRPTGSFSPSSPFGVAGLPAASGISSPVSQLGREAVQSLPEGTSKPSPYSGTGATNAYGPMSTSSPQGKAVSTAYQNYAASRMAAPSTPAPASRSAGIDVANSAMSLADQYASYGAGKVAPSPMQTASSATQAVPEAPRTVAPRQAAPYSAPAPAQPAMTPERAKALGMVPTDNVPGKYMPNVAGNPLQVARDQMGHIARNPLESLFNMAIGTLQGGVFHPGVGNMMSSIGGLFGGQPTYGINAPTRQSIAPGLTAPGGQQGGSLGYSGRTPGDMAVSSAFQPGGIFGGTSQGARDGNTGSRATPT